MAQEIITYSARFSETSLGSHEALTLYATSAFSAKALPRGPVSTNAEDEKEGGNSSPGLKPRGRSKLKGYDRSTLVACKLRAETLGRRRTVAANASRNAERGLFSKAGITGTVVDNEKKTCLRCPEF